MGHDGDQAAGRVPEGHSSSRFQSLAISNRPEANSLHKGDNGEVKSFRKELWFEVPGRRAFLNITQEVDDCLRESGVQEGLVLINAMHITASVFINDDEPGLHADYRHR